MENIFKTVGEATRFCEKFGFEVKGNTEAFALAMTLSKALAPGLIAIRDSQNYKKHLDNITTGVNVSLNAIDELIKISPADQLGHGVKHITNALEIKNDEARYFGLGVGFKTHKKGLDHEPE